MNFFAHLLLAVLWIAFCLLHSLLAADAVKQKILRRPGRNDAYYRIGYILFALLSFAAVVRYQLSVTSSFLFQPARALQTAGIIAGSGGFIIMGICIARYFRLLSGLRAEQHNPPGDTLLADGLNGYIRHPLYLGTFIFIWSLWVLYPRLSLLISNGIITVYTILGVRMEEKKLVVKFGEAYISYQKKVPMFIPRFR